MYNDKLFAFCRDNDISFGVFCFLSECASYDIVFKSNHILINGVVVNSKTKLVDLIERLVHDKL